MSYPLYLLHTPLALPFWQESNVPAIARAHWQLFDAILPLHIILLVATSWWVGRAVDEPVRKRLTTVYKSFVARSIATVQPT
jgi:peptidoglycan/LPS O-acetylase OafA/YrhL